MKSPEENELRMGMLLKILQKCHGDDDKLSILNRHTEIGSSMRSRCSPARRLDSTERGTRITSPWQSTHYLHSTRRLNGLSLSPHCEPSIKGDDDDDEVTGTLQSKLLRGRIIPWNCF